jgi:hypothetical protein
MCHNAARRVGPCMLTYEGHCRKVALHEHGGPEFTHDEFRARVNSKCGKSLAAVVTIQSATRELPTVLTTIGRKCFTSHVCMAVRVRGDAIAAVTAAPRGAGTAQIPSLRSYVAPCA